MVIISNGFNKFHLAVAAEELFNRSYLSMFLTGVYPTQKIRKVLRFCPLRKFKKLLRLEARDQNLDNRLVVPLWLPESLHTAGLFLRRKSLGLDSIVDFLNEKSLISYGRQAIKHVLKAAARGARIYHYRAGFGHESVQAAKAANMVTICDHSIAHPALLQYLVTNNGNLPTKGERCPINSFWDLILHDIEQANCVLVNSDFVKDTFLHQEWHTQRVKVLYWGVDDQFLYALKDGRVCKPKKNVRSVQVLFAGNLELRKGGEPLIRAFQQLSGIEWHLTIAGGISDEMRKTHKSFLNDPRVEYKGLLSRKELAGCMRMAEVFVFPSLAEGSARVVFEALAAGCYIITTPNSGSIVKDGVHGRIVPPGNAEALADAIRYACGNREQVRNIGERNARLIRSEYRQIHYGDKLVELYRQALEADTQR